MRSHTLVLLTVVGALVGATPASPSSNPSCVAQFVQPGAHAGRYGEVVSFLAHELHPLGTGVSANARSPKDACLVTP
jgi:hypothetical protein